TNSKIYLVAGIYSHIGGSCYSPSPAPFPRGTSYQIWNICFGCVIQIRHSPRLRRAFSAP
ncbi:hypothetical protein BS47DRAFT_1348090, partial [Hydnum rufescens UP504]